MNDRFTADAGGFSGGLAVGSLVAGYQLESRIGAGGMAVVFRARDQRLGRVVAVKMLSPTLDADDGFRRRFIRECRVATSVDHPHIIPIYDAGEVDRVLYIAMRYVPGGDVRALLKQNSSLSPGRVAAIISPVASALDAAHAAGLVHRDVKPENILLDSAPDRPVHVYLSDFGLSKRLMSSAVGLTRSGLFLGTANYASPEQIQGQDLDGRADQYALASMAFELLAGQVPFPHDDQMAVIWAQVSKEPPPLSSRRPGAPEAADRVLTKALAKSPADRYGSCREFADALRQAFALPSYDSDAPLKFDAPPPTAVVPPAGPIRDRAGQASTIRRGQNLADQLTEPRVADTPPVSDAPPTPAPLPPAPPPQVLVPLAPQVPVPPAPPVPTRRRQGTARIRVAGSAGFSILLFGMTAFSFLTSDQNAPEAPALTAILVSLGAAIFGTVISAIELRRRSRVEALVHGLNSIGLIAALAAAIVINVEFVSSTPAWAGYGAFLPLAVGNVACSAVAGSQARKLNQAEIDRRLRTTLCTATATVAISYIFFAILTSQSTFGTGIERALSIISGMTFLIAFLISCRALRIVNSQRKQRLS